MLTLIVNEKDASHYRGKATVLDDWATLARFFADNRDVLSQPAALAERITSEGNLLPPSPDALTQAPPDAQRPQAYRPPSPAPPQIRRNTRG